MEMNWKKMIDACSDINRDGNIKTNFYVSFIKKDLNGNENIVNELSFAATCNIYTSHKEFQLDIIFPDNTDVTLNTLVNMVNNFRNSNSAIVEETNIFPFINVVIVPDEFKGEYYFICLDAYAVTLTSYSPNVYPNILRFNFDTRNNDVILMQDTSKEEEPEDEQDENIDNIFLDNSIEKDLEEEIIESQKEEIPEIEEEDDDLY